MSEANAMAETELDAGALQDAQHMSTTKFIGEAEGAISSILEPLHMTKDILASAKGAEQDIRDFLAKPVIVTNGTFTTTDSKALYHADIDVNFLNQTIWTNKTSGFFGIRTTAVYRLQVNTNGFQQGRYILAWIPTGGASTALNSTYTLSRRTYDRTAVTQLPHVEIDLGSQTEAILKIPYLSTYTHYPLNTSNSMNGSRGYIVIYTYSPLSTVATVTNIDYTLYLHWEDVDFSVPCVPQGRKIKFKRFQKPLKGLRTQGFFDSAVSAAGTVIEQEQSKSGTGPITATSNVVKNAADWVTTNVPFLSEFSAPVSWAAGICSGIANFFGWANPVDLSEVTRAVQTWYPYALNCDNIDSSMPLSLMSRNQVEILPGLGGTDIDEMSTNHLLTIPAFWQETTTWTTTTNADTSLAYFPLEPRNFQRVDSVNTSHSLYSQTPVCFFSNTCALWRGGFRLTLKIVKTQFHSGRLAVVFQPYDYNTASSTAQPDFTTASQFATRHIIDIRDSNSFTLDFPYTSMRPYHRAPALTSATSNIGSSQFDPFGFVGISVVNRLTCPNTCPSTVHILMEVSGLDGFEIAQPQDFSARIVVPGYTVIQSKKIKFSKKFKNTKTSKKYFGSETIQSSQGYFSKERAATQETVGNSYKVSDNLASARLCIGERITSILQLLKMAVPMPGQSSTVTSIMYDPTAVQVDELSNSTTYVSSNMGADYYSLFSSCFAFGRGSIRMRTVEDGAYPTQSTAPIYTSFYNTAGRANYAGIQIPAAASYLNGNREMRLTQNLQFRGGAEITMGAYMQSFTRSNTTLTQCDNGTNKIVYQDAGASPYQIVHVNDTASQAGFKLMRQVGDDFQLGLFVGCPQLYW